MDAIEDFLLKPFNYNGKEIQLKRETSGDDPYYISLVPTGYLATINHVGNKGFKWFTFVLRKKVVGFISYKEIKKGLIEPVTEKVQ